MGRGIWDREQEQAGMEVIGKHYIISGRVQGVFFRDSTRRKAIELEIRGWVKNSPQGQVECRAFGTAERLAQFETWLWQGPPKAQVSDIQGETIAFESHEGFEICY